MSKTKAAAASKAAVASKTGTKKIAVNKKGGGVKQVVPASNNLGYCRLEVPSAGKGSETTHG